MRKNQRLNRVWLAVDRPFIRETKRFFIPGYKPVDRRLLFSVLCKPFSCKACPGMSEKTQTYHTQVRTERRRRQSEVGQRRARRDADGTVRPEDNRPSYSPDDRKIFSWACLGKHERRKSYVTERSTKLALDPRLNTCFSAGRQPLLALCCWPMYRRLRICLCKPFSCKMSPEKTDCNRRFCSSIRTYNVECVWFWNDVQDRCVRCPGGTRFDTFLGERIRRRPVLPHFVPPRRSAVRLPDQNRSKCALVLK